MRETRLRHGGSAEVHVHQNHSFGAGLRVDLAFEPNGGHRVETGVEAKRRIILASSSPRRRELLAAAGVDFEVAVSPAEEIHDAGMAPAELCSENARRKAAAVAEMFPLAAVIGADTLVFINGVPLGKPADRAAAAKMLRKLSGREHSVCTGVCIARGAEISTFHELTRVTFRTLDEATIARYFSLVDPLDKAGGYGIQEHGDMLVESISGNFDNVMGLPVAAVMRALAES